MTPECFVLPECFVRGVPARDTPVLPGHDGRVHDDRELVEERIHRELTERVLPLVHPERRPLAVEAGPSLEDLAPFAVGQRWGAPWGTTWFRFEGEVPAAWAGAGSRPCSTSGSGSTAPASSARASCATPRGGRCRASTPAARPCPSAARARSS